MITKLRVSNFYSIVEMIELDFTKGGKTQEWGYSACKNKKVSLMNGFYGANASGKSSILRALKITVNIIYGKFPDPKAKFLVPNLHSNYVCTPTKLGLNIILKNKDYKYDIEIIDGSNITIETLSLIDLSIKSAKPKDVFRREGEKITFGSDFKDHAAYFTAIKIPEYQTLMSHLVESFPAGEDFRDFKDNFFIKIDEIDANMPHIISVLNHANRINNVLDKEEKKLAISITRDMMSCFDKTIKEINIDTSNNGISVKVEHDGFYGKVDIMQESAGTRELFLYIYDILKVFKKGGIVVYDEINRFFHPEIESAIISLFKNPAINTANAQLFFASHNHDTLDLLNLDQIFIVEKMNHNSTIFKVSDIEDVRGRDNLKKKYSLGILGGTPDVIDFQHKIKQYL